VPAPDEAVSSAPAAEQIEAPATAAAPDHAIISPQDEEPELPDGSDAVIAPQGLPADQLEQ
jgi:hypothetical protein